MIFCRYNFFFLQFTVRNGASLRQYNGFFNAHDCIFISARTEKAALIVTFYTTLHNVPPGIEVPITRNAKREKQKQKKRGKKGSTGVSGCKAYWYKSSTVMW